MSIIKTSNIVTFVVDDPEQGFVNLYPLKQKDSDLDLIEIWHLPRWLDHYSIEYNIVGAEKSTPESWYPIGVNFWDIEQDYLSVLPDRIKELLDQKQIRLLFTYREADDAGTIRRHINEMCAMHQIDPRLILFVSGDTQAQHIPGCISFWYFDCNYFFQNASVAPPEIVNGKSRRITCLSRTHKQWRECFVYNLLRYQQESNYISYGAVDNVDPRGDFAFWPEYGITGQRLEVQDDITPEQIWTLGSRARPWDVALPDQSWRDSLPLSADTLTQDQHNDHSITVTELFQDSYWNIVLETLLDGGIFVTEKTLKPIRNGQPFVVLGCRHSLAYLREHGYRTFGDVIDESYDDIEDIRYRWYRVFQLTKHILKMPWSELQDMWQRCLPVLYHNQMHFQRSREPALKKFMSDIANYRP